MRTLIVTAANDAFMPLLRGLVESLHQWEPRPFTDLACLDLGLTLENRQWLAGYAAHIVEPQWDLPVNKTLRQEHPEWRAHTARPFLPKYFPGYEIYLWIDADTWVQERFALEWYFTLAAEGKLAITPEVDRAYHQTAHLVNWRTSRMQAYFGEEAVALVPWNTYFNSGVFALRSDIPHWDLWAKWLGAGLDATQGKVFGDQTALNYAIWKEQLPVSPLPAICNWTCHLALPRFDSMLKRFCEPVLPGNPIGILHLTAHTKDICLEVPSKKGIEMISLRFPTTQHNTTAPCRE
jgi:lipopolysaccharide biosynthesis glycosyltransferase